VILNILSDVHLSLGPLTPPETDADLVILAGDIGRPDAAVSWASRFSSPVLYVPGNHEFYGDSVAGTARTLKHLCAGSKVQVLDNDEVIVKGVRFLGTTLWTDFRLGGEAMRATAMAHASRSMRDFSRIRAGESSALLFTPADAAALFTIGAAWLASKLAEPFAGSTVVITHHAPSPKSIHPRFADSPLNPCFVCDAEHLLDGQRVRLWVHGHTHDSFDYMLNGTRVVCNPRGYARNGVDENALFDPHFAVEID
jgi:predicted phosphodiesterase